jgi:hypothetical protein
MNFGEPLPIIEVEPLWIPRLTSPRRPPNHPCVNRSMSPSPHPDAMSSCLC